MRFNDRQTDPQKDNCEMRGRIYKSSKRDLPYLTYHSFAVVIQVSSFLKMLGPFFEPRWPYSPYQRCYTLEILHVYSCGKYFRFIRGDFSNSDPKLIFPGVLVQPPGVKNLEIFFLIFLYFLMELLWLWFLMIGKRKNNPCLPKMIGKMIFWKSHLQLTILLVTIQTWEMTFSKNRFSY